MQPLLGATPPPIPPRPSLLAQAAPTMLGVVGGIAGAIIGSVIPGAGTAVGALIGSSLGSTIGGGVGMLFKASDDARTSETWMKELADYQRVRSGELQEFMQRMTSDQASALRGQMAFAGLGPQPASVGALGVPVPGLQSEAVRRFLR